MAPQNKPTVTSASNRSKRKTTKPVTKGQNPQRSNRQKVSTAKVTSDNTRSNSGTAKVTNANERSARGVFEPAENPKITRGQGTGVGNALRIAGEIKSLATRGGAAGLVMKPTPTADGTLKGAQRRGDYKPKQGPANPDQGKTKAQSFDDAFRKARKAGQQEFTWNDKRYSTRRADGK
jgi:hypothetical protein